MLEKAHWGISTLRLDGLGISRLKDGKLMGIARLERRFRSRWSKDDLWIAGGTGGVTRVGAASLRSWEGEQQDPIDYTEFGRADGLLSDECANGYPNMTTTKDGKLWVATLGGAAMLDLSRLPPAAGKPFEYISEVEVDRKKRNAGRELILPPGLHHTELQLGSIELSSPERVHMQYRLEGIDSEWLDVEAGWRGRLHDNSSRILPLPCASEQRRWRLGSSRNRLPDYARAVLL